MRKESEHRCIRCAYGSFEMNSEGVVDLKTAGKGNQQLCEAGMHAPVAHLICMGNHVSRNPAAKTDVIEFYRSLLEACPDISQALAIGKLSKSHCEELIPTGEVPYFEIAIVT